MRTFRKHIDCGIYSFDVVINRDIAVAVLEEFPNLSEYVFTTMRDKANEYAKQINEGKKIKEPDEIDILVDNIKKKKLRDSAERNVDLQASVKFAFPMMLKAAGSNLDAETLINYIYDNGVDSEFNVGIYEMILLGFTQREVTTKKVDFSMK